MLRYSFGVLAHTSRSGPGGMRRGGLVIGMPAMRRLAWAGLWPSAPHMARHHAIVGPDPDAEHFEDYTVW
jgi:hypothetical protein